jgi:prophage regulatory protein
MTLHLMGAAEIRKRLGGISRQRVWQLTTRSDFPKPYDVLEQGKVWRKNDVEEWIAKKRPEDRLDLEAP